MEGFDGERPGARGGAGRVIVIAVNTFHSVHYVPSGYSRVYILEPPCNCDDLIVVREEFLEELKKKIMYIYMYTHVYIRVRADRLVEYKSPGGDSA